MCRKNSNDWKWRHYRVGGLQNNDHVILKVIETATAMTIAAAVTASSVINGCSRAAVATWCECLPIEVLPKYYGDPTNTVIVTPTAVMT